MVPQIPPPVSDLLHTRAMQIALSISVVMVVGVVMFALVWSILTGTPINGVAGNLLSLLLGATSYGIGSQSGAKHFQNGAKEATAAVTTLNNTIASTKNDQAGTTSAP